MRCIHSRVISDYLGLKFCYSKVRASCLSHLDLEKVVLLWTDWGLLLRASVKPKGVSLSQSQTLDHFLRSERAQLLSQGEWAALTNFFSILLLHAEKVFSARKCFVEHPHNRVKHFWTHELVDLVVFSVLKANSRAKNVVSELVYDRLHVIAAFERLVFRILAFVGMSIKRRRYFVFIERNVR